jgi:arsenate reductase
MSDATFTILFLSRHNAARSILAEAVANHKGRGRFRAFSAGSEPASEIDPLVLDVLRLADYPTDGLHPKHWKDFTGPGAPALDFVFALCDHEAGEDRPPWPSQEVTADWRYPDPIAVTEGEAWERRKAVGETLVALERQFSVFSQLPPESLAAKSLRAEQRAL